MCFSYIITDLELSENLSPASSKYFTCSFALKLNQTTIVGAYGGEMFFQLFAIELTLHVLPTASQVPSKDELSIMNRFASQLGLFLETTEDIGQVCYAYHNSELRDEFKQVFYRVDILDYCYAFLYITDNAISVNESMSSKVIEIPYPTDADVFWKLVHIGKVFRNLTAIDQSYSANISTSFPIVGDNQVNSYLFREGNVYINDEQYFGNIPERAWNFKCFDYFPAQEWLKKYLGSNLDELDIVQYQILIEALSNTVRLRNEIDLSY